MLNYKLQGLIMSARIREERERGAMDMIQKIVGHFTQNLTYRKAIASILGNLIIGVSVAGLAYSLMGNDPFTAMNMAISDGLGVGLGTYQLVVNCILLIIQFIWGRNYIGFGSIVNMCFAGYVIEFTGYGLNTLFGDSSQYTFLQRLIIMLISLVVVSFGVSMYQVSSLGVSPYDFLALGLTDCLPTPYFVNRVGTDVTCVVVILIAVFSGFITWDISHLGIGTICVAFFLGPLVNAFNSFNQRWIR